MLVCEEVIHFRVWPFRTVRHADKLNLNLNYVRGISALQNLCWKSHPSLLTFSTLPVQKTKRIGHENTQHSELNKETGIWPHSVSGWPKQTLRSLLKANFVLKFIEVRLSIAHIVSTVNLWLFPTVFKFIPKYFAFCVVCPIKYTNAACQYFIPVGFNNQALLNVMQRTFLWSNISILSLVISSKQHLEYLLLLHNSKRATL